MRKISKVIKFHYSGKSNLFISEYLSHSRNTVKKYISLYKVLELSHETIELKTDTELELLFYNDTSQPINPKLQKFYNYFTKMEGN
jgi:hypothetical protein